MVGKNEAFSVAGGSFNSVELHRLVYLDLTNCDGSDVKRISQAVVSCVTSYPQQDHTAEYNSNMYGSEKRLHTVALFKVD